MTPVARFWDGTAWQDLSVQGPQGPTGADGPPGTPGSKWFTGSGAPSGSLAGSIVSDWYLDSANGDYYEKTGASAWTLRGNLKGPPSGTAPVDVIGSGAGSEIAIPGSAAWVRAQANLGAGNATMRAQITAGAAQETWVAEGHMLVRALSGLGMVQARAVLLDGSGVQQAVSPQTRVLTNSGAPEQGWVSLYTPIYTFTIPAGATRRIEMDLSCGGGTANGNFYTGDNHPRLHCERKV